MKSSFLRFVLPLAALAFVAPGSALAQGKGKGDGTGPVVIPGGAVTDTYVIDKPGSYVLGGDRNLSDASKSIIAIEAPDVTLDLGGFSLAHSGSGTDGHGITIADVSNVEVRNGSILNVGGNGVHMFTGQGLRVIDLRVMAGEGVGINSGAIGTLVDRCHVSLMKVSGITLFSRDSRVSASTVTQCGQGISVTARGGMIVGNTVDLAQRAGIRVSEGALVQNNVVTTCNLSLEGDSAGIVVVGYAVTVRDNVLHMNFNGILVNGSSSVAFVENNTITNANGAMMLKSQSPLKSVWRHNRYLTQPGALAEGLWIDAGGNISNN